MQRRMRRHKNDSISVPNVAILISPEVFFYTCRDTPGCILSRAHGSNHNSSELTPLQVHYIDSAELSWNFRRSSAHPRHDGKNGGRSSRGASLDMASGCWPLLGQRLWSRMCGSIMLSTTVHMHRPRAGTGRVIWLWGRPVSWHIFKKAK